MVDHSTAEALKTCPFCGEKAWISERDAFHETFCVGCQTFGCRGFWKDSDIFLTRAEAIEAWNRRSALSQRPGETDDWQVREAVERLAANLDGYGTLPAERQLARVLVVRLRAIANLCSARPPEGTEATDAAASSEDTERLDSGRILISGMEFTQIDLRAAIDAARAPSSPHREKAT